MNVTNAQLETSMTDPSTLANIEKAPDNIAESTPKIAVVKRAAAKKKAPIAAVERATTQRRRASVNADKGAKAVPSAKPTVASQVLTPKKVSKGKVIRDSVTMPVEDYERLGALKKKCLALGIAMKKSELLRAGLATLQRLSDEDLKRVLALVEKIKTGRPAGKEKKGKSGKRSVSNLPLQVAWEG
jgi:hypothetical protein